MLVRNVLVAGGDERALRMVPLLQAHGFEVQTLGLKADDERKARPDTADALLFPYPFSVRDEKVPTLTGLTFSPQDVLWAARKQAAVVTGRGLDSYIAAQNAIGKGFALLSYEEDEIFLEQNAQLSAEGALWKIMEQKPVALMDMTVLLTGYGRFSRALALRLHSLGAEVWIAARKLAQRRMAIADGMKALELSELVQIAPKIDLLLNTVPAQVIGEEALRAFSMDCCLLELASPPYGFDHQLVQRLGYCFQCLPGLPLRYAPASAAKALAQAAVRLLAKA